MLLIVASVLWIMFPEWLVDRESGSATIRNLVLAIAALIALPLAIWRSIVAERQATAAQKQSLTAQEQSKTARRGLLNERYQKGAEMLGSPILSVRLGGVYALERLAKNHCRGYHIQIMQLFSAFVRNATADEVGDKEVQTGNDEPVLREDVQAIMEFLGKRNARRREIERQAEYSVDLRYAELSGVKLQDADLSDINLSNANMSGAFLSNIDLSDAWLPKVNMSEAILWGANLSGARLESANLSNARLESANLSGPTQLENANLSGANLEGARLCDAHLLGADLSDAMLSDIDLSGANLDTANLSRAKLWNANLTGVKLVCANLVDANLARAKLAGAYFDSADLLRANLTGADLSGANDLTQVQLDRAVADREPDRWPNLESAVDGETGEPLVWTDRERPSVS